MTRRPITGPIVPLPPPETAEQKHARLGTGLDPTEEALNDSALTGGAPRRTPGPRSERWVYAENARYRRTLNRLAIELTRCEHTTDITADEVINRMHVVLRGANS
jgi:hypothetical protein